ncbi:FadR family transcriptional regulator [Eubacteriales bacterium OttesenSCG-928-K08]|nr:FadR family transcriptional regulator [Eubacteriales bacterium OttesenSCG-928-K08]
MNDPKSMSFEPIVTRRASEAIYEQIRDKILSGEIKPSDKLPSERKLIDMFQRSRPTIRESLRMLENSGLIKIIPGSGGAIVSEISTESIEHPLENMIAIQQISSEELFEFRTMIEVTYCGWAAQRRTEEDLERLKNILEQSSNLTANTDHFLAMDQKFHSVLAQASKNKLSGIVDNVLSKIFHEALYQSITSKSPQEQIAECHNILNTHREVLEAVESGDEEAAQSCILNHLEWYGQLINPQH